MNRSCIVIGLALVASGLAASAKDPKPAPPTQPTGLVPGGSAANWEVTEVTLGTGAESVQIFSPSNATSRPASSPVVFLFHGDDALNSDDYKAWIDHLVGRGYTVVYPQLQTTLNGHDGTTSRGMYCAGVAAVETAWSYLTSAGSPLAPPSLAGTGWIGHSLGGVIAIEVAAVTTLGLPAPLFYLGCSSATGVDPNVEALGIVPSDPGGAVNGVGLAGLPAAMAAIGNYTTNDVSKAQPTLVHILSNLPQCATRELIYVSSFDGCTPALDANHISCCFDNALDWYAFWKLGDGLVDFFFSGTNGEYAIGDTPQVQFMGICSDGVTAVTPLAVTLAGQGGGF